METNLVDHSALQEIFPFGERLAYVRHYVYPLLLQHFVFLHIEYRGAFTSWLKANYSLSFCPSVCRHKTSKATLIFFIILYYQFD
jgi:hypothetical protein